MVYCGAHMSLKYLGKAPNTVIFRSGHGPFSVELYRVMDMKLKKDMQNEFAQPSGKG